MTVDEKIRLLPPEKQAEVLEFVDFLVNKWARPQEKALLPTPTPEGLIALFGQIDFDSAWDYKAARRRDEKSGT